MSFEYIQIVCAALGPKLLNDLVSYKSDLYEHPINSESNSDSCVYLYVKAKNITHCGFPSRLPTDSNMEIVTLLKKIQNLHSEQAHLIQVFGLIKLNDVNLDCV